MHADMRDKDDDSHAAKRGTREESSQAGSHVPVVERAPSHPNLFTEMGSRVDGNLSKRDRDNRARSVIMILIVQSSHTSIILRR